MPTDEAFDVDVAPLHPPPESAGPEPKRPRASNEDSKIVEATCDPDAKRRRVTGKQETPAAYAQAKGLSCGDTDGVMPSGRA